MSSSYPDLITIIGNLSQSMYSVQRLFSGLAYVLGAVFLIKGLEKFKENFDKGRMSGGGEHSFSASAYIFGGTLLIFFPSMIQVAANTAFGVGNILSYAKYNPYDIVSSMTLIIRTAGIIWFLRGTVLLIHASSPGVQHGKKGLLFVCAGILAINFETTTSYLGWIMDKLSNATLTQK